MNAKPIRNKWEIEFGIRYLMRTRFLLFLLTAAVLAPPAYSQNAATQVQYPFQNPDLPIEKRVDDLISRMTIEEKIANTSMSSAGVKRLGVPSYGWWHEGLHGFARSGIATVFPQAIAMAATWHPALQKQVADVISTEAWAKSRQGLTIWSPNINIFRDPRWGRGQETYGEDPFLTGRFGVAYVEGLQGDDTHYLKAVATLKHFAAHSGPEGVRHKFNSVVPERALRETYLPAFEAGVREGHAWSVMSAYTALNGVPMPCNEFLLTRVLRNEWGFRGAVVGDVDNVADVWPVDRHGYVKDVAEASALSIKAGNDLCSGGSYNNGLPDALKRHLVTEADIDTALRHLFYLRFKLGHFDLPGRDPFAKIPSSACDTPASSDLALKAARESLVLLKNDGSLPWKASDLKQVAVLGPTADDVNALLGNYSGTPSHPMTILKGIKKKFEPLGVKVSFVSSVPLATNISEAGDPLPDGVLFADDAKTHPGLQRALFDDSTFVGNGKSCPADARIDFSWNEAQPVPDIPLRNAHVRWAGVLEPKESGEYFLGISFIGTARLLLDGKELMSFLGRSGPGAVHTLSKSLKFTAGQPHKIEIDYSQNDRDPTGRIFLGWKAPGRLEKALETAKQADHIILALGITPAVEDEGRDRKSILLSDPQQELLARVAALGKPFIVILTNGSALSFDVDKPNAILDAWYYGERGGDAVADALLGDYNPGGRLAVTFYKSDGDLPPFEDYSMTNRTYRYFSGKPLYAFGYGLSYTTFHYDHVALSAPEAKAEDAINVVVTVTNSGRRAGDEVVEVYAHAAHPPVSMPLQSLVGFQRINLQPGESRAVTIPVKVNNLRRWDEKGGHYVVDPGEYELRVGPSSDHIESTLALKVR